MDNKLKEELEYKAMVESEMIEPPICQQTKETEDKIYECTNCIIELFNSGVLSGKS